MKIWKIRLSNWNNEVKINIFSENIYQNREINERKFINIAKKILKFYLAEISEESCLNQMEFDTISFDFLYCDSQKTHEINKEYRNKDYPADIITFAIFADSEEKFIFDGEINLGEVIISIDKVEENVQKNNSTFEYELSFLISHGIMHLLGFDHQTMEDYNFVIEMQKKALETL